MLFYVVQKLNNKECIIYDVENSGVCCCTVYTLNQLIEMGHQVVGYDGKKLFEVDLKGNKRENKAPIMCEDLTKRSAVTIAKGLNEKDFPRVKKARNVKPFKIYKVKDKQNTVTYGFYTDFGNLALLTGSLIRPDNFQNYLVEEVKNVDKLVKDYLLKIKALRTQDRKYSLKLKEIEKEKQGIEEEKKKIIEEIHKVSEDYKFEFLLNNITGNECVKMSFYDGSLNRIKARAIIQKSNRKILYTHGLAYRNPTTYKKPITKEKAFELLNYDCLDIDFKEDCIEMNTYSSNDMY